MQLLHVGSIVITSAALACSSTTVTTGNGNTAGATAGTSSATGGANEGGRSNGGSSMNGGISNAGQPVASGGSAAASGGTSNSTQTGPSAGTTATATGGSSQAGTTGANTGGSSHAGTTGANTGGSQGQGGVTNTGGLQGQGGVTQSGGVTASSIGGSSQASGGNAGTGGQPSCNTQDVPTTAVFVSAANGNDTTGSGTKLLPYASINAGLAAAKTLGVPLVAVEDGTYRENVVFQASHGGIFVQGGFKSVGASWTRDCDPNVAQRTVIASPGAAGVTVSGVTNTAGLRDLMVATKAKGASPNNAVGESVYGIMVTGASASFRLEGVQVQAGDGGNGGAVTTTPAQAGTKACGDRISTCGSAAPTAGTVGGRQAGAITSGTFNPTGYVATNGPTGNAGGPGGNGTKGTANSATCATGCSCRDTVLGCQLGCGSCSGSQTVQNWGLCGCGGDGGPGGVGGNGGGASIAVFVSGDGAKVAVVNSQLAAGNGGAGAAGGVGGKGGAAQSGARAGDYACASGCGTEVGCPNAGCGAQFTALTSGNAGGTGAAGGDGGNGGGGSGGPSFGFVTVGTAQVLTVGTTVTFGSAGAGYNDGQGAAASGAAGEFFNAS